MRKKKSEVEEGRKKTRERSVEEIGAMTMGEKKRVKNRKERKKRKEEKKEKKKKKKRKEKKKKRKKKEKKGKENLWWRAKRGRKLYQCSSRRGTLEIDRGKNDTKMWFEAK